MRSLDEIERGAPGTLDEWVHTLHFEVVDTNNNMLRRIRALAQIDRLIGGTSGDLTAQGVYEYTVEAYRQGAPMKQGT